jgi:hypothetical protein
MAVGKYSPTVSAAYAHNQNWWVAVEEVVTSPIGETFTISGQYDAAGYDSYGYDRDEVDRAGVHENDYLSGEYDGDDYVYDTYERVLREWTVDRTTGQPTRRYS